VTHTRLEPGRVFIVAAEPLLEIRRQPEPVIRLYGHPARRYALEHRTALSDALWTEYARATLTGRHADIVNPPDAASQFVRVRQIDDWGLFLGRSSSEDRGLLLQIEGPPGGTLTIESSTNLAPGTTWEPWSRVTLTNSPILLYPTHGGEPQRYFRIPPPP